MHGLLVSTAYFPPVRYLAACLQAERIRIEAEETYPKQTCRNHCDIAGPNGRQRLTVPVIRTFGNHTRTRDIRIGDDIPWQKAHLRAITSAYNKSPYLLFYLDHFYPFFEKKYVFLLDLNLEILHRLLEALGITREISVTERFEKIPAGETDLRLSLTAKKPLPSLPLPAYTQPFTERLGFLENLSALDLIFCLGPGAGEYLQSV